LQGTATSQQRQDQLLRVLHGKEEAQVREVEAPEEDDGEQAAHMEKEAPEEDNGEEDDSAEEEVHDRGEASSRSTTG
jgi:hypothetical protein